MSDAPLRIYFVMGEASGDALGAEILQEFANQNISVETGGLAGPKMIEKGANSLFEISELAVMGFTEVIARLPKLLGLAKKTAADAISFNPDVVVLIDSPEFGYAVAKRIKKKLPATRIVKYICPSVWAWRPGRAKKMKSYVDHVLAILPFEPELLKRLDGPDCTYVGHPLAHRIDEMPKIGANLPSDPPNLLVLPGSRINEVKKLLPVFRQTLDLLAERSNKFNATLPAVDHLADKIEAEVSTWPHAVKIVRGENAKLQAFENADLALACSGTVMLELGVHAIPTVSVYKTDRIGFFLRYLVMIWTANLANLIADRIIIPERLDEYADPAYIARLLERLMVDGPERRAQLDGFEIMREKMKSNTPISGHAAKIILQVAGR